ncbi:receptor-type tyrosine-protein phosphatase S isoform X4 [Sphaeramia orbicularis]|uniref:receptor-type tyrosine-protein phosphatase S isoform X4 n=1 Tax=Sphaeramia orbicularis TaxID=375764 RepID=UPI0011815678|nr:receptor-type tyrosine-protein phosphatase S-like isoform X4 [Sphaeramia orbicularis]
MPLTRMGGAQSRRSILGICLGPTPLSLLLPLVVLLTRPLSTDCAALSPPKFTKIPTNQIGVSGGVASFVCQASGNPKPVVYWNKKGKKVNSQRIEVTIEFDEGAGAVLRIQPLRAPRDENIYECVARNSQGEVSVTAKLAIIREDLLPFGFPSIDMGPQLKVVERTRTATMLCAASGIPDPEISWFKDFLPVDPSTSQGRIKQLRSGALQIENSEETDQGKYECVATNSQGVRYSSPANLYVRVRRVPPRFSILPSNHEIMPRGSVNITCVAVGSPMPYVKWMLGSEDLTPEDEMPIGRNVLELNGVRESANYTCVAMSSLGIIEATAQVLVKSLPNAPGTPVVTETTATSVTITWDSGNPDPVSYYIIQYRAKGPDNKYETVDSITTTRYSIGGLYPNTEYEIRVSAFNSIGQGPPSAQVNARTGEQAPASPPRNVQAHIISQNTVMVRWEEPEEPNGQVKGYRVYYTMDPSRPMNEWQIHNVQDSVITTIQNLVASETYTIQVLAFTSVGDGPASDPVHVKVMPGVPGQPGKFRVGKVTDTSIELIWEPAYTKESIVNYELLYKPVKFGSVEKLTFGPRNSYTVVGLQADTDYSFSLAATSNKGLGAFTNELVQRTSQAKPSAAPEGVSCESASSTSLRVSWKPPPMEGQNGKLAGYELSYQRVSGAQGGGQGQEVKGLTIPPQQGETVVEGLEKWSWYNITMAASTAEGTGPSSPAVLCRTDEDVPGAAPRQVDVQPLNSSALHITWRSVLPRLQQGQIRGYQVHFSRADGESRNLPRIKDLLLDESQMEEDDSAHYEMILGGLKAETLYSVSVAAYTTKGDGAHSKAKLVQTSGIVPGPPSLWVRTGSGPSVVVRWAPPLECSESGSDSQGLPVEILGYRLQFSLKNTSLNTTVDFTHREKNFTVRNLSPGSSYVFVLSAKSRAGYGAVVQQEITVPMLPPSGHPKISDFVNATCCSLHLSWLPPAPEDSNGVITEYTIAYREAVGPKPSAVPGPSSMPASPRLITLPSSESSYTILGLNYSTAYEVQLRAHNKAGPGPFSPPLVCRTLAFETVLSGQPVHLIEAENCKVQGNATTPLNLLHSLTFITFPSPPMEAGRMLMDVCFKSTAYHKPSDVPRNFSVNLATKTSVLLTWEFPESSNSYRFTVEYNQQKLEVDARLRKAVIPNLQPDTNYDFMITAPEGNMGGLRHRITAKTSPPITIRRPEIDHTRDTETTITIILPSLETRTPIKNVYVVVVPLRRARGVIRHLKSPDEMDLEELLKDISQRQKDSRQQKQVDLRRAYITARFTPATLPAFFTLGDQLDYGGFENRALEPGQEYVFFILAELNSTTGKMYVASPYTDPVIAPDSDPQPLDAGDGLIWVVGPVLAVVFIICIVIAILLYKNSKPDSKRKDSEPGTKSLLSNAEMMAHHPTDPVEMRRINFQTPGMISHPPIPISELAEHIELLKANDNLRLSQEYESIDPSQQFTWEHSNLEVNKPKNRYANVIAYDHTRVVLAPIEGILGSDYINANYIDGYRKQNAYIATQGPLAETFGDFWRMVWEQRAASVVMMTRLEEKSRIKCDQYWPSRGTETYGMIQVTLLDTMELATFCIRTFSLHKSGSSERREVRQFQFTAWPDHGVPEYPTPFLNFLRRVKACNPPDAGPIIAHCSAGVGRTGCFIVIDGMLERIRHERTVDIYGHVTLMRSQRNYMVQTEDQYSFIHESLLEAVACGNTEVAARSLYSYMQKLSKVESGEHVTGMELEFKRLANTKAHTSRFVTANLPCNKFKNRLVNIMPYETTRVCLQPIRGLEGSDYINASYIDGYRQQRGYIATQGPLAETTEDFWRMLWEHNSTIVVMLTKLREMGREKCHQYWPAERSARYQYFVVDPMAEYNMPQYILREFKVTDARDGQSRTVRQFQFTDWPEQGVPKSGEGFIDFIGQVHKTKEQFGQDGPISVHCSAGVGRTGVFITLSIVLERMRYEGAVDIFQTVKMLRTQRPAMVQTEDEYQFCYQAALEYLGSFDHYAT